MLNLPHARNEFHTASKGNNPSFWRTKQDETFRSESTPHPLTIDSTTPKWKFHRMNEYNWLKQIWFLSNATWTNLVGFSDGSDKKKENKIFIKPLRVCTTISSLRCTHQLMWLMYYELGNLITSIEIWNQWISMFRCSLPQIPRIGSSVQTLRNWETKSIRNAILTASPTIPKFSTSNILSSSLASV